MICGALGSVSFSSKRIISTSSPASWIAAFKAFRLVSTVSPLIVLKLTVFESSMMVICSPRSIISLVRAWTPVTCDLRAAWVMWISYPCGPEVFVAWVAPTNSRFAPETTPVAPLLPSSRFFLPYWVFLAIRFTVARILSISCWSALSMNSSITASLAACTASWRALINAALTSSRAASAVCTRETPASELSIACFKPAVWARNLSLITSEAGPSAPRLIFKPEDKLSIVLACSA